MSKVKKSNAGDIVHHWQSECHPNPKYIVVGAEPDGVHWGGGAPEGESFIF